MSNNSKPGLVSARVIARELPEYFGSAQSVIRAGIAKRVPMHVQHSNGTRRTLRYRFDLALVEKAMVAGWNS